MSRSFTVQPVSGALGAEVHGVDLNRLDDEMWQKIYDLWLENMVLFFPEQQLTPEGHIGFARRFGDVEIHPFLRKYDDDHAEIVVITSEDGDAANWHTDVTFKKVPPKASVLRMAACPPRGGDTLWTNQCLVYESLSPPMQEMLDGLTAVHTAKGFGQPEVRVQHPAVIVHPETGRRALFVNGSFTSHFVQLRPAESDALLEFLLAWSTRPEVQCRYRWTEGAIAIWDNRCTQHYAAGDYDAYRRIERVTVLGDEPPRGGDPKWPAHEGSVLELYRSRSHVNPPVRPAVGADAEVRG